MTDITAAMHRAYLIHWLRSHALPVWWEAGADREHGGFFESVQLDGNGAPAARRARVQPRQVYCFAEAGRLGWQGPWEAAIEHGLSFFDRAYLRSDGIYGALASAEGVLVDESFDLYNQAFALFAFAQVARAVPSRLEEMSDRAEGMLSILRARFGHPAGGFEEAEPRRLPLRANPHMHLFEAALAWEEVLGPKQGPWSGLSEEIARLCMGRFIDAETGALREFFDADWRPELGDKGRVVEPGHQFEWAWLLARWGVMRGNEDALRKAKRLFAIGVEHGICPERGVAVMAIRDDFSELDPSARLWAQTEWLKAALRLALLSDGDEREHYLASVPKACAAMRRFFDVPVAGLWRDKMLTDGSFVEEPAPGSSFYHVICAIVELGTLLPLLGTEAAAPLEWPRVVVEGLLEVAA